MSKSKSSINEFEFSSKEKLEKEVQKELKKFIREEKKLAKNPDQKTKKEDSTLEEIFTKEDSKIRNDINLVARMTDSEKIDWFCDKMNELVQTLNLSMNIDVLDGTEYAERYLLTVIMQEMVSLLSVYNIEFSKEMTEILVDRNEVNFLAMLNTLNYL